MNNSARHPYPNDLGNDDLGTYSRTQIINARKTLLATVQSDHLVVWQNLRYKLKIREDGRNRLRSDEEPLWIPKELPQYWSAPVVLQNSFNDETHVTPWTLSPERPQDHDANANELHSYKGKGMSSQTRFRLDNRKTHGDWDLPENSQSKKHLSPPRDRGSGDHGKTFSDNESRKRRPYGREESEGSVVKRFRTDGSNRQAWEPGAIYEMMYKCDICGYTNTKNSTMRHLWHEEHYSASHCLGFLNKITGVLEPKYTRHPSVLRREDQQWKGLVPACPQCHKVFQSAADCVQHAFNEHGISDTYVLRKELRPLSLFRFASNSDYCLECRKEMSQIEMSRHMKETSHMASAVRGRNASDMTIFLCQFCDKIVDNYYVFKAHVLGSHPDRLGRQMLLGGASLHLGGNVGTLKLLPPDPGVPSNCINFDFSSQAKRDRSLEKAVNEEKQCLQRGSAAYTRLAKSLQDFLSCRGRAITLERAGSPVKSELALLKRQQEEKKLEEQQEQKQAAKGKEPPQVKKNARRRRARKSPTDAANSHIQSGCNAQQLRNLPDFLSEVREEVEAKEKKNRKKKLKKQIIKQKMSLLSNLFSPTDFGFKNSLSP